jgi:Tfp pilus assembly protein PilF/lysophospholipase L1-like esterase
MMKRLLALAAGVALIALLDILLGLLPLPARPSVPQDPFLGFSGVNPVFESYRDEGGEQRLRTSALKQKWFNSQNFSVVKPEGTKRIFALGGSTTYGRPFFNQTSFSGWLQKLLDSSPGEERFEVINAGGISYASYRVKVVLSELLAYEPDLIIIFTGHNEFLESRTYPEMSEGISATTQLKALLGKTNTYKLLENLLEPLARGAEKESGGNQALGVLGAEVETLLDESAGLGMYRRDTVFAAKVFDHFRFNVAEMIRLCQNAGVPVLFCTPVDNLKDFSPFKSSVDPAMTVSGRQELQRVLETGEEFLRGGKAEQARGAFADAVKLDSLYAMSHYKLGRAMLAAGDTAAAAVSLLQARELDVCPLRAQQPVQRILAEQCRAAGVDLLDLRAVLAERSPGGIIGDEYLMDDIHPGPEGHLIFAGEIYNWMMRKFAGWGLDADALPGIDEMLPRELAKLDSDYFQRGVLNLVKVMVWAGKYSEAGSLLDDNPALLELNGEARYLDGVVKEQMGDSEAAVRSYASALKLMPDHRNSMAFLASLYSRNGYYEQAENIYRRALDSHQDDPQLHCNLGILLANTGREQEAVTAFNRAHELEPSNAMVLNNMGLLAFRGKQPDKALEYFRQSLTVAPDNPQAHNFSGLCYMMKEDLSSAEQSFIKAVEVAPEDASVRTNLGNLYRRAGKIAPAAEQFRLALMFDSRRPENFLNLVLILRELGQADQAAAVAREGLKRFPDHARLGQLASAD